MFLFGWEDLFDLVCDRSSDSSDSSGPWPVVCRTRTTHKSGLQVHDHQRGRHMLKRHNLGTTGSDKHDEKYKRHMNLQ